MSARIDLSSQGDLKKRDERMNVVVTNLDNTNTTYGFAPTPGLLVTLEDFYRDLFNKGTINGFTIIGENASVVSHKSI